MDDETGRFGIIPRTLSFGRNHVFVSAPFLLLKEEAVVNDIEVPYDNFPAVISGSVDS